MNKPRQFTEERKQEATNQAWVTDITYIKTCGGSANTPPALLKLCGRFTSS